MRAPTCYSISGTQTNNDTSALGDFTSGWKGERTSYQYQTTVRAPESAWAPVLTLASEYQDQPDGQQEVRRPR